MDALYVDLVKMFLPAGILEYFDIIGVAQKGEQMTISLEEKNELPEAYKGQPFHSKGFLPPVLVEDFPIRGNKVLLQIKRRRWEQTPSPNQRSNEKARRFSTFSNGAAGAIGLSTFEGS